MSVNTQYDDVDRAGVDKRGVDQHGVAQRDLGEPDVDQHTPARCAPTSIKP